MAMFEAYEDDDRPATAVEDLGGELGSTAGGKSIQRATVPPWR